MNFESHSQAFQDQWVFDTLVAGQGLTNGLFLDIGCGNPVDISNTCGLERIGWRGILVDADPFAVEQCRLRRFSKVIQADATRTDWSTHPAMEPDRHFDYLSLDIDAGTAEALERLLAAGGTWRMATFEHDFYRFGPAPRATMREMMLAEGYTLHRADVCCPGHPDAPFEDWWLDASLAFDAARTAGEIIAHADAH